MMMKGGLPPNGKNTVSGFNKPYKNGMMIDPNRPSSAQVKQTRPFVSQTNLISTLILYLCLDSGSKQEQKRIILRL